MEALSVALLIALGIALIVLEMVVLSFYLIWLGIAFVIVGIISFFYTFGSAYSQLALGAVLAVILLLLFKERAKKYLFRHSPEHEDVFLNEGGEGVVKEGRILYKGTYWDPYPSDLVLPEGQRVKIKRVRGNQVEIEPL
ncbi:MAG: hypothetical protein B6D59_01540 [Campylobacteraceae bacterium 4484_4]|nr:MAG: hypothetical protein B6D59_01540 [Campylobacteraceae bacterium 4484_4]